MKKINRMFLAIFSFVALSGILNADAAAGQCKVHSNGTIIAAWQSIDSMGQTSVTGAIGSVSTDPSTWTTTILSTNMSTVQNSQPLLSSNANGDVVVTWQYPDSESNFFVAAAMLPSGTTTWNTATISTSGEDAGFNDQVASIDEDGNVLAMWTIYDPNTDTIHVRGATAVMGTSTTWDSPVTIDN